jgi:hypothetical protein
MNLLLLSSFWLVHHDDWSRWFAISSSPPIFCPGYSCMGGLTKKYIKKQESKHQKQSLSSIDAFEDCCIMCISVCPNSISQHSNTVLHPKCCVHAIPLPPPPVLSTWPRKMDEENSKCDDLA